MNQMNIVVIDGYTLHPGDLSWESIASLGQLTVYDRTPAELIVQRCKDADIILTNTVPLTAATLEQLPRLKMIAVTATGYNIIDTETARATKPPTGPRCIRNPPLTLNEGKKRTETPSHNTLTLVPRTWPDFWQEPGQTSGFKAGTARRIRFSIGRARPL